MIVRKVYPFNSIPKFFEGAPAGGETISKKDFDDLKTLVTGLTKVVQVQSQTLNAFRTQQQTQQTQQQTQQNNKDDDDDEVDVNSLDNKGFAEFMMKSIGKILETKLGEVNTKIENVNKDFRNSRAVEDIEKFRGLHKDLDEWGTEIGALAKQHPTLGIQQLYTLARTSDPEKAKTIDAKYAPKTEEPKEERLTLFGGYRPESGKTTGDDGKTVTKMTTNEALEKSWNDAVAKFPALKSLGDDSLD